MYELILFTGGVYKFDEFEEFIDDLGGLIIEMESFKFNRGMYFLSEEMRVLVLIPEKENEELKRFVKRIKGTLDSVQMKDTDLEKVILIFEIYKIFEINETMNFESIIAYLSDSPDFIQLKNFKINNPHKQENFSKNIEKLLIMMEEMKLIKKIEKEKSDYYKINLKNI
ncbi:MAG: hypothetical protein FWE58_02525 [Methanobrevibacter sp.]|nr:hypothetical protein [Methanobrevibacter sp.]